MRLPRGLLVATLYAAACAGVLQLAWFCWLLHARLTFPLDLEWMEGGLLVHADRLAHGQPIYAPPSVDFIPFLYTPFYPYLLAAFARLLPLGYVLGRSVSVASFVAVLVLIALAARSEQARSNDAWVTHAWLPLSLAGAGAVAASFAFTGSFYDLVRADSLLMLGQVAALCLAWRGRRSASAVLAGVVIGLAFFTKQTASIFGLALGVGLLVTDTRRALLYGASALTTLVAGLSLLQGTTQGWFWTYTFELHQSHPFDARVAFLQTPRVLLVQLWPTYAALAIGLVVLLERRALERRDALLACAALGGVLASCVGSGTQWAFANAYIPAVIFPTTWAVLTATRLARGIRAEPARAPFIAVCVLALGLGAQAVVSREQSTAALAPSERDRTASHAFLRRLRALPGRPFIPFHPYYATLLGRQPAVHRMGVWDVADKLGQPAGLASSIAHQKFGFVVLDADSRAGEWPELEMHYRQVHVFREGHDAVRAFSGAATTPRSLWLPK